MITCNVNKGNKKFTGTTDSSFIQVRLPSFILTINFIVTVRFLFQAHVYSEGNDVYDVMLNQVKCYNYNICQIN